VDDEDAGALAGEGVVVGEIAFELRVAVLVVNDLGLEFGESRVCPDQDRESGETESHGKVLAKGSRVRFSAASLYHPENPSARQPAKRERGAAYLPSPL
jgi:hypothetical protein